MSMSDAQERQNTQNAENIEGPQNTHVTPLPAMEEGRLAELEARNTELETQLAQAKQEASDNWNRFVRERADVENIRKRQERMLTERVQYQRKSLLQKFLGVLDNVDRALMYYETMDKQQLQQTLRMVQWQMNEVMRSEGLNQVPTVGETFNPYVHEAIEAVENSDEPVPRTLKKLFVSWHVSTIPMLIPAIKRRKRSSKRLTKLMKFSLTLKNANVMTRLAPTGRSSLAPLLAQGRAALPTLMVAVSRIITLIPIQVVSLTSLRPFLDAVAWQMVDGVVAPCAPTCSGVLGTISMKRSRSRYKKRIPVLCVPLPLSRLWIVLPVTVLVK